LPYRQHTGIMGASMGGLISLYAFFQHRDVFWFAGVMSPSAGVCGARDLRGTQPEPLAPGTLYLDIGSLDGPQELVDFRQMCALLIDKGYRPGSDILCVEEPTAEHDEPGLGRQAARGAALPAGTTRPKAWRSHRSALAVGTPHVTSGQARPTRWARTWDGQGVNFAIFSRARHGPSSCGLFETA